MESPRTSGRIAAMLMAVLLGVWVGLAGQNVPAQSGRVPSTTDGIWVHYGTGEAGARHELPSNDELGIDINHFIGNAAKSHPYVLDDAIIARTILQHGDPLAIGDPGAILEYRKELAVGELMPGNQTALAESPDEMFLWIEGGEGRLDDGRGFWDLREGITAIIPAHVKHRFVNTSDKTLTILMLTWEEFANEKPGKDILVRDSRALPFLVSRGHWNYASKILFTSVDGLSPQDGFSVAYLPPMGIGDPHAHPPHHEEIWIKLPPADRTYLFLGSEIQRMPANSAFLAPVTGETTHSIINLSDKLEPWIGTNHWPGQTFGLPTWHLPTVAPKPLPAEP